MDSRAKTKLLQFLENGQIDLAIGFVKAIETTGKNQISGSQRGALHLYLSQVAHEANNMGLTLQDMVKVIKKLEIRPNTTNLKETFLKPYIKSAFNLDSSEKMSNQQITEAYDALNLVFSHYWHICLPFPTDEQKQLENLGGYKSRAGQGTEGVDYPELTDLPKL